MRDRQREQTLNGIQVIKEAELPLEVSRQGCCAGTCTLRSRTPACRCCCSISRRSRLAAARGRPEFQGGQVMMITEGRGYTTIDGVKHPWKAGDVLNLPLRADGIIVQHFNADPNNPAKFVAVEPNWLEGVSVDRGCGFEQLEDAPEYRPGAPAR